MANNAITAACARRTICEGIGSGTYQGAGRDGVRAAPSKAQSRRFGGLWPYVAPRIFGLNVGYG